ncbi:hypothetical protein GW17_00046573, partial [Ensete ventricosum]
AVRFTSDRPSTCSSHHCVYTGENNTEDPELNPGPGANPGEVHPRLGARRGRSDRLVCHPSAERAWEDRDVLAHVLCRLHRRWDCQLWPHSHGRHPARPR